MSTEHTPPILTAMQQVLQDTCPEQYPMVESLLSALYYAEEAGHTCVTLTPQEQARAIQAKPIVGSQNHPDAPLILWQNKLFFARLFRQEQFLAQWLQQHQDNLPFPDEQLLPSIQATVTKLAKQGLHEAQLQAVILSLIRPFLLICGGPGTGKTTTVASILLLLCSVYTSKPLRIALAAPTGKAAARMTQALHHALSHTTLAVPDRLSNLSAQTLHRLLGIHPITAKARFHPQSPLPFDIIVVDEASMLDLPMLVQLFQAIKSSARLIFLGDPDQLPAIGAGAFVHELSAFDQLSNQTSDFLSQLLPDSRPILQLGQTNTDGWVTHLTASHRFKSDSAIGQLALAVKAQQTERVKTLLAQNPTLRIESDYSQLFEQLYQATQPYWQAVEQNDISAAFRAMSQLMILAPLRYQCTQFNEQYIPFLRRKRHQKEQWFAGLPIMVVENDYQLNLFNGDIGVVLFNQHQKLAAFFESADGFREIPLSRLPHHEPAFAITVHKSQGSEYESVWLLMPKEEHPLFSRSLFYTAITRAKTAFTLWGDKQQIDFVLQNTQHRQSALKYFLI